MLYRRQYLPTLLLLLSSMTLSGCGGLIVAGAAVTTANIVTDTRSTKEIWQDHNIEFEATALGNKPPFAGNVRIAANSFNGKVVLMGQAKTQQLSDDIARRIEALPDVEVVHNQIRIQEIIGVTQMSQDSWITTKVKSALLAEPELNGVKIKVITENNEVFLFGYVTPEHAQLATDTARNTEGVQHVIRGFEVATVAGSTEGSQQTNLNKDQLQDNATEQYELNESPTYAMEGTVAEPDVIDSSQKIIEE